MDGLKLKTKNNSNPRGKSRVYFSCHPKDIIYLDRIADAILKQYDCVIYYNDYKNIDESILKSQLSQMQLIIVPITKKFLVNDNIALNIEFKYAVENNIPLLPLLLEDGVENIYKQKCGDTQYLDVTKKDDTAISFHKKANDLISAVLLNDEDIDKIRQEFDAYIFLSYRKKDRLYSKDLMKLIHENKDLQDVAIWYDEFLVPGENFNTEINEALTKSDLFMLLVTPNLVIEDNYVMNVEYPNARKNNKPVVAVEAVKTDACELASKYLDIPDCIPHLNKEDIVKAIMDNISHITLAENDEPYHNYLIGLAYLKGVDMEVDVNKGVNLILDAARKDCVEAIEEAIKIYTNGIGVEKNIDKVLYWRNKLVEYYQKNEESILHKYSKNSKEYIRYFEKYFQAKLFYADTLGDHYDVAKCEELLKESKSIIDRFEKNSTSYIETNITLEIMFLNNLDRTSRYKEAINHYVLLIKYLESSDDYEGNLKLLLKSKIDYAINLRYINLFDESIKEFRDFIDNYPLENLKDRLDIEVIYDFYITMYAELGTSSILKDSSKENLLTIDSFEKALYYTRKIFTEHLSEKNIKTLVSKYHYIANFGVLLKNFEVASKLYNECLELLKTVENKELQEVCNNQKSNLYCRMAKMYKEQNNEELFLKFLDLSVSLLNQKANQDGDELEQVNHLFQICKIYDFVELHDKRLEILMQILSYDLNKYPLIKARTCLSIGQVYEQIGEYEKATKYLLEVFDIIPQMKDTNKNFYYESVLEAGMSLAYSYNQLGYDISKGYGEAYKMVVDVFLQLPKNSPFLHYPMLIDVIYYYAASRMWNEATFDEAHDLLWLCIQGFEKLQRELYGDYNDSMTMVYSSLFEYYIAKNNIEAAMEVFNKGMELSKDISEISGSRIELNKLLIAYYLKSKDYENATSIFNSIFNEISKSSSLDLEYINKSIELINLWSTYLLINKDYKNAISYLEIIDKKINDDTKFTRSYEFAYLTEFYCNMYQCYKQLSNSKMIVKYRQLMKKTYQLIEDKETFKNIIDRIKPHLE